MAILQIREAQMRALRQPSMLFRVEGELRRLFPAQCREMSSSTLYQLAEYSIDQAKALGFDPEQYVGFASLILVFGPDFWEQPEYEWAKRILDDRWLWTPAHRMQELREASVRHLAALAENTPVVAEEEEDQ